MARIFVGVPTYNRPDYVADTLRSLQAQSFADWRAIVSDNGSAPEAAAAVARLLAELSDPRIEHYAQPSNGGEYGQGRFFLAASAGSELMMILHDDDVLAPSCLEEGAAALDAHGAAAFFVANAYAMTPDGRRWEAKTAEHLRFHGRDGAATGAFDVLERHMACGFAPISGTLFRREALVRSGFVDADLGGNYPFECNLFVRLGEAGCQAWFSERELVGVRYHAGALRSARLLRDPHLVATAITMWERRRFTGVAERRRRAVLARYYRAQAEILASGGGRGARAAWLRAVRTRPTGLRAWAWAPVLLLAPGLLRRMRSATWA